MTRTTHRKSCRGFISLLAIATIFLFRTTTIIWKPFSVLASATAYACGWRATSSQTSFVAAAFQQIVPARNKYRLYHRYPVHLLPAGGLYPAYPSPKLVTFHNWRMPLSVRRSSRLVALQHQQRLTSGNGDDDKHGNDDSVPKTRKRTSSKKEKEKAVDQDASSVEPLVKRRRGRPRKVDVSGEPKEKETKIEPVMVKKLSSTSKKAAAKSVKNEIVACLPRHFEKDAVQQMQEEHGLDQQQCFVMGIDEAGRGPLAGPVVIAGIVCPLDIEGVVDSKKITKEDDREALYETIMELYQSRNHRHHETIEWAVCIMDAAKIDEINILQATLEGMKAVTQTIVGVSPTCKTSIEGEEHQLRIVSSASIEEHGCYVVCSEKVWAKHQTAANENESSADNTLKGMSDLNLDRRYHALVDGNRLPQGMPCPAEAIVKGDGREFSIAAASILAKVTRDRLMRAYDGLFPHYNLQQHKGYPTAQHMELVKKHGASKIHRRTFAPLKHMSLDDDGQIVD